MKLDTVGQFSPISSGATAQTSKVYRSRSPTNHVPFHIDDAQRKFERHHLRLERKLAQQIKLAERRLTRLEARIQVYEDRIQDLEDRDDLTKQYRELSEAQNELINAQKSRISDLERQGIVHTSELARTYQLNRNLSATVHCRDMTIYELKKRMVECTSNYATIANLSQNHGYCESSYLKSYDSKTFSHAGQDDTFTEFFPNDHILNCSTGVAESTASQAFTTADNISPTSSCWQFKESASPTWQMSDWQTSAIPQNYNYHCDLGGACDIEEFNKNLTYSRKRNQFHT